MSDIQRLQNFFRANQGRAVSLPRLGRVMSPFSVTKRISELRARGFVIENSTRRVNGRRHSVYVCKVVAP